MDVAVEFDLAKVKVLYVRHTQAPLPEGCRWCGFTKRAQRRGELDHSQRYVLGRGFHSWEQPTAAQMLMRGRARYGVSN